MGGAASSTGRTDICIAKPRDTDLTHLAKKKLIDDSVRFVWRLRLAGGARAARDENL